jgi:hypothetical protein
VTLATAAAAVLRKTAQHWGLAAPVPLIALPPTGAVLSLARPAEACALPLPADQREQALA